MLVHKVCYTEGYFSEVVLLSGERIPMTGDDPNPARDGDRDPMTGDAPDPMTGDAPDPMTGDVPDPMTGDVPGKGGCHVIVGSHHTGVLLVAVPPP